MEQERLDYVVNVSSDFAKEYEAAKNDNTKNVSAVYFVAKLEEGVTLEQIVSFSNKRFKYNFEKPAHDSYNKLYANCKQLSPNEALVEMVHSRSHDSYNEWDEGEFYDNKQSNIGLKVENGYLIGRASLEENQYHHMLGNGIEYSYSKDVPVKKFKEEFLDVYLDALRINLLTKGEKEFITKNPDKVQTYGKENNVSLSAEYDSAKVFEYNSVSKLKFNISITKDVSEKAIKSALVEFANNNNFRNYDGTQVYGFSFGGNCRNKNTGESFDVYKYKSVSCYLSEENMMRLIDKLNEKNIIYSIDSLSDEKEDKNVDRTYKDKNNVNKNISEAKEDSVKSKNAILKSKVTKEELKNNENSL